MNDSIIEQYEKSLTEEEKKASDKIYNDYKNGTGSYQGYNALSDETIIESIFHGDPSRVQQRMKEVDDIHVKPMAGGGFRVSRYSEENETRQNDEFRELKRQNEELKKDFEELKNLIIEKLK